MDASTVGFKNPAADLHRKSPYIFVACFCASISMTAFLLLAPLPHDESGAKQVEPPPVIINLQNIPKTRQIAARPAPPRPFVQSGNPIEVEEILPDDITIEDTAEEIETAPAPPLLQTPSVGAAEEESQIFQYYAVEEKPERTTTVAPEYPPLAERAKLQGTVFLRLLVNTEGVVDSVIVEKGPDVFHSAAVKAASATKFKPAKQNDRPVACWVILPFRFILEE